jgi:hypothetical protein
MSKILIATLAAACLAGTVSIASASTKADGLWSHDTNTIVDRRRPRVPGGSGCDDPRDVIEHPECR